jgi:hypothetical protein
MYAAGAEGSFDALALHPYQGPAAEAPEAPPAEHPYRITNVEKVRQVMVEHGDAGKPIWFTEFGWTTGAGTGWQAGVDEATQADFLRRAMVLIQDSYPYVTHAFWFTIRDRNDWTPYENSFGLLRLDGSPKPSYGALHQANSRLRALPVSRTVALTAAADTVVRQQVPTVVGGTSSRLLADVDETSGSTGSRATSYLRFQVPALLAGESISSATLRLHVTDPTSDGPVVWRTHPSWDEKRMSWRSGQPPRWGTAPVADLRTVLVGTTAVPLTGVVEPGPVSFQLHAQSSDGLRVSSREAVETDRPQLVLEITAATGSTAAAASTLSRRAAAGRLPAARSGARRR